MYLHKILNKTRDRKRKKKRETRAYLKVDTSAIALKHDHVSKFKWNLVTYTHCIWHSSLLKIRWKDNGQRNIYNKQRYTRNETKRIKNENENENVKWKRTCAKRRIAFTYIIILKSLWTHIIIFHTEFVECEYAGHFTHVYQWHFCFLCSIYFFVFCIPSVLFYGTDVRIPRTLSLLLTESYRSEQNRNEQ